MEKYQELSKTELPSKNSIKDIKRTDKGKPYIDGFSNFSISHTDNIWAVIFSDKRCGLDIQNARNGNLIKIAGRVFCDSDVRKVNEYGEQVFFKLWTRKEAYVKAIGGSIFDELPALYSDDSKIHFGGYTIFDFYLKKGIYMAVCIEGIIEKLHIERVKL